MTKKRIDGHRHILKKTQPICWRQEWTTEFCNPAATVAEFIGKIRN